MQSKLQILYDSSKVVVVNKASNVAMQGKPTLPAGVAWRTFLGGARCNECQVLEILCMFSDLQNELRCTEPLKPVQRLDSVGFAPYTATMLAGPFVDSKFTVN